MIGRQELFLDAGSLRRILERFGIPCSDAEATRLLTAENGFAEPLLRLLGAEDICSLDASHYEHASIVHDMNTPVPDSLKHRFSAVIDAGTLEHVFNFPTAIRNCMEMVESGGHLLLMTPTNNFMGHGFYQFSPELFFRVLSGENGYEMVKAIVCEVNPDAPWYQVVDPAKAQRRVELVTTRPAYLLILARRISRVPLLSTTPQQSDYTVLWQDAGSNRQSTATPAPGLPARILRAISRRADAALRRIEPAALAERRLRPDGKVFIPVNWQP
jgi:hypothetical protein